MEDEAGAAAILHLENIDLGPGIATLAPDPDLTVPEEVGVILLAGVVITREVQ